jgi:segregation and condensation protein B
MSDSQSTSNADLTLSAKIEAMLFVSAEPVPVAQLAAALDITASVVERGLKELDESLLTRGLRLQRNAGRVQLTTAPELAELVELFLGLEAITHLSRAALETLAIRPYRRSGPPDLVFYNAGVFATFRFEFYYRTASAGRSCGSR